MKNPRRLLLLVPAVIALGGLLTSAASIRDIAPGTGYSALELCTRTMLSGEAFHHVRAHYVEPKVRPLPLIWRVEYVPQLKVSVSTRLPLLAEQRVAVFRRGLGCTVIPPQTSEAAVRAQTFRLAPELPPDDRAWPLGEGAVESQRLESGLRARVEEHAALIFSEPNRDPRLQRNTTALLIARDGHLVYERYGQGYARERPQLGWSMTKTLTALIAGLFAADGKLELDAPVGLPQWRDGPKRAISWRQLLNMAPGLRWDEGYGGASDATEMLFSQAEQGAWAAELPLSSTPGSVFTYSTGFTNIAMLRMRQLLGGKHQPIYDYYQRRLFAPLGIRHGVIEPDASGTPVGGARGVLRPVDWLRLAQLVADGGRWEGRTILPAEYVAFMLARSPASPAYGGSIWREASAGVRPALRSRLPDDLVYFAGHLSQFAIVVPSQRLVVLRMGVDLSGRMQGSAMLDEVLALVADLVTT
jgi:CubicO group peptidase (beta-lactamase class C family)